MAERKHLLRAGVVIVFFLVIWVLYVSSKQIERNKRIEEEVTELQTEAEKIRRENETLSEKIGYFSSTDFREQEAKEKLGMKKTDESVVVIKQRPEAEGNTNHNQMVDGAQKNLISIEMPNYKKWWELFFKEN